MSATRRCPHPACSVQVPAQQFSCRAHWEALPADVRREIGRTNREYRGKLFGHRETEDALRELRGAQQRGIEFYRKGTK